jgi:hypothetical protein
MSDLWTTSEVGITMTSTETGAGAVNRSAAYDPSLVWDPNTGTWTSDMDLLAAGGGRYHQQIVMVGRDATGYGRVYFG